MRSMVANRLEAIASRLEANASSLEAICYWFSLRFCSCFFKAESVEGWTSEAYKMNVNLAIVKAEKRWKNCSS